MADRPVAYGISGKEALGLLVLVGLLLVLFCRYGTPVGSDGYYYFAYLPSLVLDGDLNFANQYSEETDPYTLRDDEGVLPPNPFPIGAAILWLPFFVGGRLLAVATGISGALPGYGPMETHAIGIGSVIFGGLAIFFTYRLARAWGSARTAVLAALGVGFGSSLVYYTVAEPSFAHAPSAFLVSVFLWLWWRWKDESGPRKALLLGLLLGLAGCVRPQNLLFVTVPLIWRVLHPPASSSAVGRAGSLRSDALFLLGGLVGFSPQMTTWWVLYGSPLTVPQGREFFRWAEPAVGPLLFSTRHGLFAQTPITFFGSVGLLLLLGRNAGLAFPLLVAVALQGYLNAAVSDWWAGSAFGMRRFASSIPLLGVGLAVFLDACLNLAERRQRFLRRLLVAVFVLFFVWFNGEGIILYRRGVIPGSGTWSPGEALASVAGRRFRWLYHRVGDPFSFPANWLFAARFKTSPDRYDLVVGHYFLYDLPFPGVELNFGRQAYAPFVLGGFLPIEPDSTSPSVCIVHGGIGRALIPLYGRVPCDLRLRLAPFFAGPDDGALVRIVWNKEELARLALPPGWSEHTVPLAAEQIRIGVNELSVSSQSPTELPFAVNIVQEVRPMGGPAVRSRMELRGSDSGQPSVVETDREGIYLLLADEASIPTATALFDTSRKPWDAWEMRKFVDGMPEGTIVIGVVTGDAARNFAYPGWEALQTLGCCVDLRGYPDHPYAFIGRKGSVPGTALETFPSEGAAHLTLVPGDPLPLAVDWVRFDRR